MEKQEYPKWLYHSSKEPKIVLDEAAHKKAGKTWHEEPVEAKDGEADSKEEE